MGLRASDPGGRWALDPAERLAGLQLDEEASKRCACRLYPAGVIVPAEGCPEHPEAVSTFESED